MKAGDYVRTKHLGGSIEKIIETVSKERTDDLVERYITDISEKYMQGITAEQIIKSSPNIIDLIEVGDYVNGNKIIKICYDHCGRTTLVWGFDNGDFQCAFAIYENEIKSIVTKEQFERMEYKYE